MACIFCMIANKEIPGKVVYEDDVCMAFLDLSQTTYGHTLVVPKKHMTNILEADSKTASHLFEVVTMLSQKITKSLNASGCNILSNAGEVAGQTVMHFHIHIIPRYNENDGFKMDFAYNQDRYDLDEILAKINH